MKAKPDGEDVRNGANVSKGNNRTYTEVNQKKHLAIVDEERKVPGGHSYGVLEWIPSLELVFSPGNAMIYEMHVATAYGVPWVQSC